MRRRLKTINSFTIGAILFLILGGVGLALTQIAQNVSATVDVQVTTANGIDIYMDSGLTQIANNISFGTVEVDIFGTPTGQGAVPVPVWVKNQSSSAIALTLNDDFGLGDVSLGGSNQAPILQPGEVLQAQLLLNFHQGVAGTHPFTVMFQAEGPVSGQSNIILVTTEEPLSLGVWSPECGGNQGLHIVCRELATDPMTWFDTNTLQPDLLSGFSGWESVAPDRWRFSLRPGVFFHNGEPWNAAAAKSGLDLTGDPNQNLFGHGFHGDVRGEVVNDLTVDVVCAANCPIFPRTAMFTSFQAPQWWASTGQADPTATTVGFGPYEVVEWRRGVDVALQAFAGYVPNGSADSRAPVIDEVVQVWNGDPQVRASMVAAGQADWAENILFDDMGSVPKAATGGTDEVFTLVADTIWHPELKKKDIRRALAHAIDCNTIMQNLYNGVHSCFGNIAQAGTVGITTQNSAPYQYDPTLATQLLNTAGYDSNNEIRIYARSGRIYRDVELWQALVASWQAVGVNASLHLKDAASARDIRLSGCGQLADPLTCPTSQPPGPFFASSHYYEGPISTEILDFQRIAQVYLSCFSTRTRVCDPTTGGLEDKIQLAVATPEGVLRQQRMEELASIAHDEYYFLPIFEHKLAFGMAGNLQWQPRHDSRVRINTMSFGN